ncbi:MAG: DUF5691 domain-containing protein [Chloroflexota bacterium]
MSNKPLDNSLPNSPFQRKLEGGQSLVKIALLGTQRAALPKIAADTPLGQLIAQLDQTNSEHQLLSLAGALSLQEQVGQQPAQESKTEFSLPPTSSNPPTCSEQHSRQLGAMLGGRYQELLSQFLKLLSEHNLRVPEMYLPNLLEKGAKSIIMRPHILPVLGATGRWLAAQNPAWAYAAPEIDTWDGAFNLWQISKGAAQHSLLRQLRLTDPERGRQILESTWKSETPATRSSLIKALQIGLSIDDEPFLEMALDDRHQTVRQKAAEYLTYLPESRLCQRMIHYTRRVLNWTPENKHQITVLFPRVVNPQMVRDGVQIRQQQNSARARSLQLVELVSAVPLSHWEETWQTNPESIVKAVQTSRWPRTLTRAFTVAAERQGNAAWATALLAGDDYSTNTIRLVAILSPSEFETLIHTLSQDPQPLTRDSNLLKVLRRWPDPWSETVAQIWLDYLAQYLQNSVETKGADPTLRTMFRQFGKFCPPYLTDTIIETLLPITDVGNVWRASVLDLVAILRFRQTMLASFDSQDNEKKETLV